MKIGEVKNFPKALLKKKCIPLYKAFIFEDSDQEMNINKNIDVLSLTKEAALETLINEMPMMDVVDHVFEQKTVSFAIIKLDTEDFVKKDVVDHGDVYFENDKSLSITLKDKIFKIDVEDYLIENIVIDIDHTTEKRVCKDIKLVKA